MPTVSQVMSREVQTVAPDDTVQFAAQRMRACGIGSLPVCREGQLVGTLTDRDIAVRVVAPGRLASNTRVEEVMSDHVVYCGEDEDVEAVLQIMGEDQIRRLPVVRDGRLVGIVALADLARSRDQPLAQAVREISSPVDRLPE
ncbi:CBS domain-containing protein [Caldimonas sp. KR1-144]|uniref:CBS domain-containing protein n=1 Tax=Caldimonas sp. KR1-144 TaxID=3400911 RepID=UPI003C11B776